MKFLALFFLMLFVLNGYSGQINKEHFFAAQNFADEKTTFTSAENFLYNQGEIPSAQVVFNSSVSSSNSLTDKLKIKALRAQYFHSLSKVNTSFFIPQGAVFSRYSSAFQQIFLKTACFRL